MWPSVGLHLRKNVRGLCWKASLKWRGGCLFPHSAGCASPTEEQGWGGQGGAEPAEAHKPPAPPFSSPESGGPQRTPLPRHCWPVAGFSQKERVVLMSESLSGRQDDRVEGGIPTWRPELGLFRRFKAVATFSASSYEGHLGIWPKARYMVSADLELAGSFL